MVKDCFDIIKDHTELSKEFKDLDETAMRELASKQYQKVHDDILQFKKANGLKATPSIAVDKAKEIEAVKLKHQSKIDELKKSIPETQTVVIDEPNKSGESKGSVGVGGDVGVLKDGNGNVMGKGESKIIEVSPDGKQVKVDNVNGWHPIELFEVDRVKSTSNKLENLSEKDFDKLTPSQKVSLYKEHGITKEDGSPITEKDIENSPLQYSYDFMASSESGKWNSANSELESLVKDHRKAYSLYKMLIGDNFAGDNNTFKDIVDYINNKTDANIEYTDRMRRADETMSAEERQAAVDSYNKSAEGKTEDKVQKEKDILEEHGLADETEYSPHELVEKFPLKGVQKVIWDIIKPIVEKLGIKVKFSSSRITEGFDGSNNPMNGEILLRPSTLKNGRLGEVLVHEVVHSLTTKIISRVNSGVETGLTGKQVAAVKGLNKLYKSIEADNNLQNKYPVKDIFEFIAHLTNDSFVKELESKDRNFIQKVVDYISDILGLSNANELAKKYLKDIIHDGTFLEKEGITVVSSDYAANVKGAEGLTPKQRLLEAIKNNSKTTAEKYHDLKSKGKENDFTKAVEQSLSPNKEQAVNEKQATEIPNKKEGDSTTESEIDKATLETEAGEGNGKEPPKGEEPVGEGDNAGITHAAIAELRKLIDLPEYEGKPKETHEQLISEAQETIKNNPNAANEVLAKMENGGKVTNKDNAILAVYKAAIDVEMKKNPTKELLERATRLSKALDVSGTELGKALESRKLIAPEDNLTNFLLDSQSAQGTALSETQIKSEAAKYEELKAAKEALEKQLEVEREQHAKDIAEMGLNKAKAKARKEAKKSDTEYKQERKKSVDAAREALKKLRESGLKSTVPLIQELGAIAPHVKDFFNSLASQGIDKLDNIITQVHAEFKDVLEGITNKNILDIVSGQFDEPKTQQTRNEKANNIRLINREVQLLKELELARKGEEKAKTEKDKTASNRRIDELKEKIKEVRRQNKNKEADNEAPEDAVAGEIEYNAKLQKKLTEKAQKLTQEIKDKKYLEEEKLPPVFKKSRKTQLLEDKVIDLENKVRHDRSKAEYEKRSKWRKGFDKVMEVLGVRRLVQSALDMSVPFRQGATLISPRKIDVWAKGFAANLQSIFSPKKFERIMHEIRNDPMYHEMVKDNVVFNDLGSADPNLHNEDFRKSFIYKIPIISEPLKASNRSADAFLNVARIEMYKKLRSNLEKRGLTRESDPKAFKFIGNWTMAMTGRGTMHSALEKPAMNAVLGNTFYGARLMASRFNLLNPVTYFDPRIPKEAKREAMKDMAAFTITMMSVGTALAYTTGAKISLNPDDGDFLQLRYGDKVYDISGGLSNYVKTGLRIVKAGYTKATKSAEEGDKATDKAGESALNFIRNKFSPNTSYAVDAFFGGRYGEEFDPSDIYRIYPMYTDDFLKAIKEEGGLMATSTVLLPNILGIGFNSYTKQDKTAYDWDKDTKESTPFKTLTDNQVKLPEVPSNKKNMVIEDDTHPEGKMTEEEYKIFTEEWKKEVKKGVDELYNKGRIKTTTKIDEGGNVVSESNPSKVSMSDIDKDNLEKELSSIKSEATEIAKKKAVKQSKTITTYEKRD